jgi:hypothetical protein
VKSDTSSDRSKIAAVRKALNEAVKRSQARELTDVLTDDVVAVHEDGRCMCGKQEVEAFFRHAFARYDIEAMILSSDVVVHNNWAIEVDEATPSVWLVAASARFPHSCFGTSCPKADVSEAMDLNAGRHTKSLTYNYRFRGGYWEKQENLG